ncbi:MAG: NAD(P)-binding protein, partial [Labilithrix sp.]|nr:NAD(P)-binding protein [Labilithrix sp.]
MAPFSRRTRGTVERDPVIVVVGGGLAGLTCAYELGKIGLSPIVLERGGH